MQKGKAEDLRKAKDMDRLKSMIDLCVYDCIYLKNKNEGIGIEARQDDLAQQIKQYALEEIKILRAIIDTRDSTIAFMRRTESYKIGQLQSEILEIKAINSKMRERIEK